MKSSNFIILILLFLFFSQTIFPQSGFLDTTFGDDGKITVQFQLSSSLSLQNGFSALQADGKTVFAGVEIFPNSSQDGIRILRYNTDGTPDNTFGNNGAFLVSVGFFENVKDLKIQADGKILVSGDRFFGSSTDFFILRLNSNGTLDTTFGTDGVTSVNITGNSNDLGAKIAIQTDGKIILVGRSDLALNPPNDNIVVVRLTSNGSLDPSFSGNGIFTIQSNTNASAKAVGIQSGNKIIVGGYLDSSINLDLITFRLNSSGGFDLSYGTNGFFITPLGNNDEYIENLEILPDNMILLTGTIINNNRDIFISRFTADGELDLGFGNNGVITKNVSGNSTDYGIDIARGSDGKFAVLGRTDGEAVVFRFNSDGSPDLSFGLNGMASERIVNNYSTLPSSLSLQDDGKPVISGISFSSSSSPGFYFVARFLTETVNENQNADFDFDGDGKTDIGIWRPAPGEWWYLRSSDKGNRAFQFGQSSDKIVPADFTGDDKTDIAFWRENSGEWFVLRSEDNSFYAFPFGTSGDIPSPADFDGDGKADPAVFRPSDATWYILNSGGGTTIQQFGANGDKPIPSDFDGDGKDDIAVFRPSFLQWYFQQSSDLQVTGFQFGNAGDRAIPADYTGDGKTDIAFWRQSNGVWYILRSEDSSYFAFPFGASGDIPVPGDYDGDGKDDAAVFRPSNNTWFLQQSTDGFEAVGFGINGDVPIPSAYNP